MMLWIVVLRAVGTLVLMIGVGSGVLSFAAAPSFGLAFSRYELTYLNGIVQSIAVTALCFGAAAALRQLDQNNQKLIALGRILSRRAQQRQPSPAPPAKDLAPVAPEWDDLPEALPAGYVDRRIAQHKRKDALGLMEDVPRAPAPAYVREEPSVARTTPGAEDQYAPTQQPRPRVAQRPPTPLMFADPDFSVVDRDLLRRGRDKQIRRVQAEQARRGK